MVQNPLSSHVSDATFEFLVNNNLIKEKGVRDFMIRRHFLSLREECRTQEAIEILQKDYPYLQHETIRKIIYQKVQLREPEFFYLF